MIHDDYWDDFDKCQGNFKDALEAENMQKLDQAYLDMLRSNKNNACVQKEKNVIKKIRR